MRRGEIADVLSSAEENVVAVSASWDASPVSKEDVMSPSISGAVCAVDVTANEGTVTADEGTVTGAETGVQGEGKQYIDLKCDSVKEEMKEYCAQALQELRGIVEERCARVEEKQQ
ncbi:hypothetical protein E2C01_056165 [Portunus trituberculatus]|uniref:Uncharacterized protein n=1 Tax=Portunus trituberculatus TaxID=210409 RepID=A0A5B7GZM4_PORTR|nr:hypothetical protein [Portunus trituberculatus]